VEAVLNQTNPSTPLGIRDRAILETLYSTGIRRLKLMNLKLYDLDFERGTLMIRQGKGHKDRLIPIGNRALLWVEKYLREVRPGLLGESACPALFLTSLGEPFSLSRLSQIAREYVDAAKLGKRGSCHLFRHTMATLMLEGGTDIRFIKQMLGHADLSSTQIYTQVSISKLKEVHTATHPARVERKAKGLKPASSDSPEKSPPSEELFSSLAAEVAEEEET
ncbi:MAG: tyrosine-type recombinase/integrase, partial [Candidatus Tectomicrobia bacterium]|nr:tyrosine-type recombinase/integrase [Candidatus Tectomicrobia bacterium]